MGDQRDVNVASILVGGRKVINSTTETKTSSMRKPFNVYHDRWSDKNLPLLFVVVQLS